MDARRLLGLLAIIRLLSPLVPVAIPLVLPGEAVTVAALRCVAQPAT